MLVEDLAAPRHPGDGGGRAWLDTEESPAHVPAATAARLEIVYEAGPHGIAEGGLVFLQPSPFWDWDPPQIFDPGLPGYTTVVTDAEGVELLADDGTGAFLAVEIAGRALAPGERVRFVYGAGEVGARVDRFAEDASPIYVSVDADGDGVRSLVEPLPRLDVSPRDPVQLHVAASSAVRPGEPVRIVVAALDGLGSPSPVAEGGVVLVDPPAGPAWPDAVALDAGQTGRRSLEIAGLPEGVHRITVRGTGDLEGVEATSNPVVVRPGIAPVLWGDLHGHSQLSDGTGTPEQYFRYARDVAGLDVAALTDHDHWGLKTLDADPAAWGSVQDAVDRFHAPGRFVTLLGYEWTSWLHGHRHVLYFDGAREGEVLSSLDERYATPALLWAGLRDADALTFAHHSAGGPVSTNWRHYPPDPELEPVTEIVSVHGSSEAPDSPAPIYDPVPGNYVRDAVNAGFVLGFIGSGDSHDGHPGLVQLADGAGSGGLAAIRSSERTRRAVKAALRARDVYATNGPRIWLDVHVDGRPMGSVVPGEDAVEEGDADDAQRLVVEVAATAPIERIDLVRSGATASLDGEGRLEVRLERDIPPLRDGEYHYVRVVQRDGGAAWSSPIFARSAEAGAPADAVEQPDAGDPPGAADTAGAPST